MCVLPRLEECPHKVDPQPASVFSYTPVTQQNNAVSRALLEREVMLTLCSQLLVEIAKACSDLLLFLK